MIEMKRTGVLSSAHGLLGSVGWNGREDGVKDLSSIVLGGVFLVLFPDSFLEYKRCSSNLELCIEVTSHVTIITGFHLILVFETLSRRPRERCGRRFIKR